MSLFDRAVVGILPALPRPLVHRLSRPYIAGASMVEAVNTVRDLNARGMMATLDVLGEELSSLDAASAAREEYLRVLEQISSTGIDSNISIKLTQLGLRVDAEACFLNLRTVVARASELGCFVRIDMEDSSCTTETLRLYHRLRETQANVGLVLQSMLRRTLSDAEALGSSVNVRLVKGIYLEPRRLAWRDPELINRNFTLVLERLLEGGSYVAIATHDERLVWEALRLIRRFRLSREQYEFQMLLGVEEELRQILLEAGHRLRVYVPFGEHWYAYSLRRLRENPRLAGHVALSALRRRRESR